MATRGLSNNTCLYTQLQAFKRKKEKRKLKNNSYSNSHEESRSVVRLKRIESKESCNEMSPAGISAGLKIHSYRAQPRRQRQVKAESRGVAARERHPGACDARISCRGMARVQLTNTYGPPPGPTRRNRAYRLTPRPTPRDNVTPDAFTGRSEANYRRRLQPSPRPAYHGKPD